MTATPIPVGYGIATLKFLRTGASVPYVFTFGYAVDVAITATVEATNISGRWTTVYGASSFLNSYTYVGCHVLRHVAAGYESGDLITSLAGTVNAPAASPAAAVRVTKRTAFVGRKYRGRVYLPPFAASESNVDTAGVIDGATLAAIQTRVTNFLTAMNASNNVLKLLHTDLSTPNTVTSLLVRNSVGTQRRRQKLS